MFDHLVIKVIDAAKKNRRLLIPAVVCLWILFTLSGAAEAVRKHYGVSRTLILLFCCLAVAGTAFAFDYPVCSAASRGAVRLTGALAYAENGVGLDGGSAGETAASLPANQEDKSGLRQNELVDMVTKYVKMLKINQVTPDWAPDLSPSGSEPKNRVYYEKAWRAYEELTEESRDRLAPETREYLLTCRRTVAAE